MKKLLVKLTGKDNSEFIVKNPKKIEFWKMMGDKIGQSGTFVRIEVKEI